MTTASSMAGALQVYHVENKSLRKCESVGLMCMGDRVGSVYVCMCVCVCVAQTREMDVERRVYMYTRLKNVG